jgi:hypothetical protein
MRTAPAIFKGARRFFISARSGNDLDLQRGEFEIIAVVCIRLCNMLILLRYSPLGGFRHRTRL